METNQEKDGIESIDIISNSYSYYPCTLTDNEEGDEVGISKSSQAYNVLFENYGSYWLASLVSQPASKGAGVGMRLVTGGHVGQAQLWDFFEGQTCDVAEGSTGVGIRAVVSLNSNVTVDEYGVIL